jgi:hypothetical protein
VHGEGLHAVSAIYTLRESTRVDKEL